MSIITTILNLIEQMENARKILGIAVVAIGFAGNIASASVVVQDSIPSIGDRGALLRQRQDSIKRIAEFEVYQVRDTLDWKTVDKSPFISIQQFLKGNISGLYVQEKSGEPGSMQNFLLRGLSSPIFTNSDISGVQPVVFVNGLPLLTSDTYLYNVKSTDVNPLGSGTNILAGLNISAIESIEVVKDAVELARLGPLAANGAILVKMKDGYYGGKNFYMRASGGMSFAPGNVSMTNAAYERNFRMQFADVCNTDIQRADYLKQIPAWMQDLREMKLFGTPDWADDYYRMAPLYNMGATLGGGGRNANYLFTVDYAGNAGVADETNFNRFSASFALNMTLIDRLEVNMLLNGSRVTRVRNRNLRDRYAEIEYFPDMTIPLSPSHKSYVSYLNYYEEYQKDNNENNLINGYLGLRYNWDKLSVGTRLLMDYNTNVTHHYWPSGLMESVSALSDFSGYNRRMIWQSTASYNFNIHKHFMSTELQEIIQNDVQHYNYSRAYQGTDDMKSTIAGGGFRFISRYSDKMTNNLISTMLSLKYRYFDLLEGKLLFRYDGASSISSAYRWMFTPAVSVGWNLKNQFFRDKSLLSDWSLRASWARIGRFVDDNRFGAGPQYTGEELTGFGQPVVSSFWGYSTIARPYNSGWIGYDMKWPYSDKLNIGTMISLFKNRIKLGIEYYNNTESELIVPMPVPQELGYKYKYQNGMKIRNTGVELTLSGDIMKNPKGVNWNASLSLSYNKNKLCSLPGGYNELVVGDRKLKVGHSIDEFWVYQNAGIYESDEEVPVVDGQKLSMDGLSFSKADPKWEDVNGDNIINEDDKVLKGHMLPSFTGSFTNTLTLGRFDLGANFFFSAGHDALNYRSSQRYNYLNLENRTTLESVREIFFWQNTNDNNSYPLYNQMSKLTPYRVEQDMFLEKLNYLKLRSLTLGYTLSLKRRPNIEKEKKEGKKKETKRNKVESLYLYITGNNLFTLSNFSGDDPELIDFDGYYRGYGQPIPRSIVLGVKFNF